MKLKKEVEARDVTPGEALILSRVLVVLVMIVSLAVVTAGFAAVRIIETGIEMLNAKHAAPRMIMTAPESCPVPPETFEICDTRDPACDTRYRIERSCTERCHTSHHRDSSSPPRRFPPLTFDDAAL